MTNEEILGIMNDADEVMESINYDPFGMNTIMEAGVNVSIDNIANVLNTDNLTDPMVVSKLKKEIQSAKKWDKVLKVVQRLNAVLAGGVLIGGGTKIAAGNKTLQAASQAYANASGSFLATGDIDAVSRTADAEFNAAANLSNTKAAVKTILLIQAAVAVLAPLIKKGIKNHEITKLAMIKSQINSSISLYETQMKNVKSKEDKQKLQDAIDRLKDLKETMDSESERLTEEDNKKSDK